MALNENIVIRLMADTSNYTTKMQAASAQAEKLSTSMERPRTTSERLASGFMTTGLAVGALSAAIGVAAVSNFAKFDAKMSEVAANTGATGSALNDLREAALNASRTSIYSAEDAADAINELGKAGVSVADILNGGLHAALSLAATDNMSVGDATQYMASAMTQFGLSGNQAGQVADALAAGANKALGSVSDMGEALSMVGSTSHMLGANMQETVGTLSAMANAGNIGSDAGTELRSALIGLMSPSVQVSNEMKTLGLTLYNSQGNFVGIANFAGQLHDRLSKLPEAERNNAMGILFSNAAMSAANTLYNEGEKGISKWTKAVSENGYAAEIAAKKTDNFKGDLTKFEHTAQDVLIGLGSAANGPLRSVTQNATNLLNLFRSMPQSAQQWTLGAGLIIGAATGMHKVFGNLQNSSSAFSRGLSLAVDPIQRIQSAASGFSDAGRTISAGFGGAEKQISTFGTTVSRGSAVMSAGRSAGKGLVDLMGGPWGIAMAGAGVALAIFAQKQADAKTRTDDLTTAMQNGQSAASKLAENITTGKDTDWGWYQKATTGVDSLSDALRQAGVSQGLFIRASMGNKASVKAFYDAIEPLNHGLNAQPALYGELRAKLDQTSKSYRSSKDAIDAASEAEDADTKAKVSNTVATATGAKAVEQSAQSDEKAATSKEILADAFGATADGINDQAIALGQVVDALKTYYGFALSASNADVALHDDFDKVTSAVKSNGATLDLNTEKGRANQTALNNLADAAQNAAEAHAKAGDGVSKVSAIMQDARNHYVSAAEAMGKTPAEANAMADSMGLTADAVSKLVKQLDDASSAKPVNVPLTVNDEASKVLEGVNLKAEALKDGKTVVIKGDNKPFLDVLSKVTGAKLDPKKGTITADKKQYDTALMLANKARVDAKTGYIYGDNTAMWKKLAKANGWTIDPKTGRILGDDGPFRLTKKQVDSIAMGAKTVTIYGNSDSFIRTIQVVKNELVTLPDNKVIRVSMEYTNQGEHVSSGGGGGTLVKASGGYVSGPGTGTSDSIPARLSNGEYVMTAATVRAIGVRALDSLNYRGYAQGGLVRAYGDTSQSERPGGVTYMQPITIKQYSVRSPGVQSSLTAGKIRSQTRTLLGMA
jgi:TP901 family phage tail tape measure protein